MWRHGCELLALIHREEEAYEPATGHVVMCTTTATWTKRCFALHEEYVKLTDRPMQEAAYNPIPSITKADALWRTLIMDVNSLHGVCGSPKRESGD